MEIGRESLGGKGDGGGGVRQKGGGRVLKEWQSLLRVAFHWEFHCATEIIMTYLV